MTHQFHPTVLREYDIRGVIGTTLDAGVAHKIGKAFGKATPEDRVAVYDYLTTRDARPAGIQNDDILLFILETGAADAAPVAPSGWAEVTNSPSEDTTGTSAQQPNNFNAPTAVCMAAVLYVFRSLVDDDIPLNAGCLKPLQVNIPVGSMLNPNPPASVVAGNVETSTCITNALFGALVVMAGSQPTMNNFTFGNAQYQYYETISGGSGAGVEMGDAGQVTGGFDGTSVVQTHMTNSRLTDPEVLEFRFPVRLESYAIRQGSGGAGRWRGGDGAVLEGVHGRALTVENPCGAFEDGGVEAGGVTRAAPGAVVVAGRAAVLAQRVGHVGGGRPQQHAVEVRREGGCASRETRQIPPPTTPSRCGLSPDEVIVKAADTDAAGRDLGVGGGRATVSIGAASKMAALRPWSCAGHESMRPVSRVFSMACWLSTGSAPGRPRQTGQLWVFGVSPNEVRHEQNILVAVLTWAWTSRPMVTR